MMVSRKRGLIKAAAWIAVGVFIGVGLGLLIGWVVWPTQFTEADPTVLEEEYQRDYTLMIASAYWMDDDLISARNRLESLGIEDYLGWYREVTVDHILNGRDETQIRHLVNLAADIGVYSPAMDPFWPGESEGEEP